MADLEYESEVGVRRYSRLAILAVGVPLAVMVAGAIVISIISRETLEKYALIINAAYVSAAGAGMALGIVGVIQIRKSKGRLRGRVLALAGATLGAMILAGAIAAFVVIMM